MIGKDTELHIYFPWTESLFFRMQCKIYGNYFLITGKFFITGHYNIIFITFLYKDICLLSSSIWQEVFWESSQYRKLKEQLPAKNLILLWK